MEKEKADLELAAKLAKEKAEKDKKKKKSEREGRNSSIRA